MKPGYVYILTNRSFEKMIKIGRTYRDSKVRAKELSNTSVPHPFVVAYEVFTSDCHKLEKKMHDLLEGSRVNDRREFFLYPLSKAIDLLIQEKNILEKEDADFDEEFEAIEILPQLLSKYSEGVKDDITSVRIVQIKRDRVWLEITTTEMLAGRLMDITIKREDLGFIVDHEEGNCAYEDSFPFFNVNDSIKKNVTRFLEELGDHSIAMVTDILKTEYANKIIRETK